MAKLEIDAVDAMRNVKMVVRVRMKRARELAIRLWAARQLIVAAAWLMNCNIIMDVEDWGEE